MKNNSIENKEDRAKGTGGKSSDGSSHHNQSNSCPVHHNSSLTAELNQPLSWKPRDLKRWLLAILGVICVGLGALGTVVPGLPTTIFVIIAVWCFSRSCPWLEQKLLRNKMFGPSMEIIDGRRPFTKKARGIAMGMMFFFGFSSIGFLHYTDSVPKYVLWIIFSALIVGAISIVKFNPKARRTLSEHNSDDNN